jgi:hypothetical protein
MEYADLQFVVIILIGAIPGFLIGLWATRWWSALASVAVSAGVCIAVLGIRLISDFFATLIITMPIAVSGLIAFAFGYATRHALRRRRGVSSDDHVA